MLAFTIYISLAGAAGMLLLPRSSIAAARWLAMATTTVAFVIASVAFVHHPDGLLFTVADHAWIPSLGVRYHLAADGISLAMVLLTGLIAVCGVLFSWNVTHRVREFFALYLLLIAAVYGVFLSYDLFLLLVFYEIVLVPKYFLIAIWGSTNREYGAMKLAIYSFVGGAMALLAALAAYVAAGSHGMALDALAAAHYSHHFQMLAFPLAFAGFGILAGMWPFHTWAPTGHVAAPTAASMLLAGVVMKLGAYGCLRVAMVLFADGLGAWSHPVLGIGSWRGVFTLLAVIGIVYGASVALVQRDFKFVIGYSSVSHMGFVLLGLMTLTSMGMTGAVVQMFSHGVLAALLFAIVGRMVYDRTHTRELAALGHMRLSRALPFAAIAFVLAAMASMGLPGFSGFVGEFMVLSGTWRAMPVATVAVAFGILLGVAYMWRAVHAAFFADANTDALADLPTLPTITLPEKIGATILLAASVGVGLFPQVLTDRITPALQALASGRWQ